LSQQAAFTSALPAFRLTAQTVQILFILRNGLRSVDYVLTMCSVTRDDLAKLVSRRIICQGVQNGTGTEILAIARVGRAYLDALESIERTPPGHLRSEREAKKIKGLPIDRVQTHRLGCFTV
jgi:hypothetical protein